MIHVIKFIALILWGIVFYTNSVVFLRNPAPDRVDYLSMAPHLLIVFSLLSKRSRWVERSLDAMASDVGYALGYRYTPVDKEHVDLRNAFAALGGRDHPSDEIAQSVGPGEAEKLRDLFRATGAVLDKVQLRR